MSNINSSINLARHLKLPLFASEQVIHLAQKVAILGWDPSTKQWWNHKTSVLHGFFGRNICKRRPWPITRMFQVAIMTDHFAINAMAGCMMCLRFQIPKNIFNFKRSMTRPHISLQHLYMGHIFTRLYVLKLWTPFAAAPSTQDHKVQHKSRHGAMDWAVILSLETVTQQHSSLPG